MKKIQMHQLEQYFVHPVVQYHCAMALERIQFYSRHIKILEEIIFGAAAEETDFELLQTLPGVGKILTSIIMYEKGENSRFPTAKPYSSNVRVVPGITQSSSSIRRGKGSKQGNPYLKFALCKLRHWLLDM